MRLFTNNITKQLYNITIMIELTTRQERDLWYHYTRLLKEHSSRKIMYQIQEKAFTANCFLKFIQDKISDNFVDYYRRK